MTRPPNAPSAPGRSRRRRRAGVLTAGAIGALALLGMIFVLPLVMGPDSDPEPSAYPAVGERDGRAVAVVAYDRSGGGGLFQPMFQTRLTAIDLATGDIAWDVRLNEELVSDSRVLAAEDGLSYVATDEGLYIRSLADGSVVAEPDAIEGIGDAYVAQMGSYDYDPERGVIVAIDTAGTIHSIPVGESVAEEADAQTAERWLPVLGASRSVSDLPTTGTSAQTPDGGTLAFAPTAPGAQTQSLTLTPEGADDSGGQEQRIGGATFFDPRFVIGGPIAVAPLTSESIAEQCFFDDLFCEFDGIDSEQFEAMREAGGIPLAPLTSTRAAGSDAGYALVLHRVSANGDDYAVSNVSLRTGKVVDTVETGYEVGSGASADATTVFTAYDMGERSQLIVVSPEGALSSFEIGRTNLLGMPW